MWQAENIWALAGFLPFFLFYLLIKIDGERKAKAIGALGGIKLFRLIAKKDLSLNNQTGTVLLLVSYGLLVAGAVNFRKPVESNPILGEGIEVMFVLDVSKSMWCKDVKPTRLAKAKQFIYQLSTKMPHNKVGVISFAGKPYLQMPLSSEIVESRLFLESLTPESLPDQGTSIGEALQLAQSCLEVDNKLQKAIVLLSDGEDHEGYPKNAVLELSKRGIHFFVVGFGTEKGGTITDPLTSTLKKDDEGNDVVTKLHDKELRSLASDGLGQYYKADDLKKTVSDLSKELSRIEKRKILFSGNRINYKGSFWWLTLLAFFLLLVEAVWDFLKNIAVRNKINRAVLLVCFAPLVCDAQENDVANPSFRAANESYRSGELKKAEGIFKELIGKGRNIGNARFDLANTYYREKKFKEAIGQWGASLKLTDDPYEKARILYNQGLAKSKLGDLNAALKLMKSSLALNPMDENTRENLQLIAQSIQEKEKAELRANKNGQPPPTSNREKNEAKLSESMAAMQLDLLKEEEKKLRKLMAARKNAMQKNIGGKDW